MRTNSTVAIIVSDLETHPSLPRMMQSVARQSDGLDRTEIIVAGSGAHPSSSPTMWSAITGIDSIRLINIDNDATPALARNRAIEVSDGELLLFLRPDYRLDPKYLTTAFSVFEESPDVDIMYTDYIRLAPKKQAVRPGMIQLPNFDELMLMTRNILGPAVMVRREAFKRTQGFRDNTVYRDWDLWIQAAVTGSFFYHVNYPLASCEHDKVSFRERAEDGRNKAMLVVNNPSFFHENVIRWAVSYLRGEAWTSSHGFMTIPGPMDVSRMHHDHVLKQMGADSMTQEAIRQFDSAPHTVDASR